MPDFVLDASHSSVKLQTFAEGLLARLAHDLELSCGGLSGTAKRSEDAGKITGAASIAAPLRGIIVAGVLGKDGRADPRGLSPDEQRDVLAKMQHDVFHASSDAVVRIEAQVDGGPARIRIVVPSGRSVEVAVSPEVRESGDGLHVKGTLELSLKAIGADAVKGPMGAFRVKDRVRVVFDVVFVAAPPVE